MDLSDGRNRVAEKRKPPLPLIFTLPYSGEEIMLLPESGNINTGIVYDPLKTGTPIPWRSDCQHCLRGQQTGFDINVKRAIRVLASRQICDDVEIYTVPTNNSPSTIWCKRSDAGLIVKIIQLGKEPVDAIWQGRKFITQDPSPLLESKILGRILKLLGSVQASTYKNARACLTPLLNQQRLDGIDTRRRLACLRIDWASLLSR